MGKTTKFPIVKPIMIEPINSSRRFNTWNIVLIYTLILIGLAISIYTILGYL